jgi:hypothetical protein
MFIDRYVKYRLFLSNLSEFLFKLIFEKYSNIKFHENPSNGSRGFPYGRTDRRRDIAKLEGAFRNFANAPESHVYHSSQFYKRSVNSNFYA